MTLIARALLSALLTAALAGAGALAGESGDDAGKLSVAASLEFGSFEHDFSGSFTRPSVTVGQYRSGLNWEARARSLFSSESEGIEISGYDARGLVGWDWQLTEAISVGAVGGLGFYYHRFEFEEGHGAYDLNALAAEFGGRFRLTGPELVDLVGQATIGPVLMVDGEGDNDVESGSYVAEVYAGIDVRIPQYNMVFSAGFAYERLDVEREDDFELVVIKTAIRLGLTYRF